MAWLIKDEWLDLAQARHVVIFHNPDTKAEHHLIHHFNLKACPTCGQANEQPAPVDFEKLKADTLASLKAHHQTVMQYRNKFSHVRLGNGPK